MKLRTNNSVHFDEATHTYTIGENVLMGVTSLMKKHLFADKYTDVPESVLKQASERGSKIHALCQMYHILGVADDSEFEEVANYVSLIKTHGIQIQKTEYLVSDNEHFATMIDCVGDDCSLYDIKTTAKLDREYLSWQLSIGAYLFERQNPHAKVPRLYGIWLRNGNAELVEVPRIESIYLHELFNAEIYDLQYENPFKKAMQSDLSRLAEIEGEILMLKAEIADLEAKKGKSLEAIKSEMQKSEMQKMEDERLSITLVADRKGCRFDSKKFKAENAELYEKYQIESTTKGHIKIKIK